MKCPADVQRIMSSESTPVLSHSIPAFEMFMTMWESMCKDKDTKSWVEVGLAWAKEYYIRMDNTQAYIISMCE
jgi:hypothetical protein